MLESSKGAKPADDVKDPKLKGVADGKVRRKQWRIKSKEGTLLEFYPVFEVNEEAGQVECRYLELSFTDEKGNKKLMTFDWLNIYMFVYYTCNEELRQGLAQRYERKVNYIPYDVEIKPTAEERGAPTIRRRVELPIDELTMAVARDEAWRIMRAQLRKGGTLDPRNFLYKKGRRP